MPQNVGTQMLQLPISVSIFAFFLTSHELHLSRCYLLHRYTLNFTLTPRERDPETIILNSPEQSRTGARMMLVYLWNVFELLSRLPLSGKCWRQIAVNYPHRFTTLYKICIFQFCSRMHSFMLLQRSHWRYYFLL